MPRYHSQVASETHKCLVAVIWIDWYAYHLARFAGLQKTFGYSGEVSGIELVGGVGVHDGLKFREGLPQDLPVETLMPDSSWKDASKLRLASLVWQRLNVLNPQLVLVPGYYTLPAIAAALWAKLHGRVSILMTESTAEDHHRVSSKELLKSSIIRKLFDWAVTGGRAHVRYLTQLGFREERIVSFYDVVDNETLSIRTDTLRRKHAASFNLPETYFL